MEENSVESVQAALMAHAHQCAMNQENKTIRSYTTLQDDEQGDTLPKPPIDPTHSYVSACVCVYVCMCEFTAIKTHCTRYRESNLEFHRQENG